MSYDDNVKIWKEAYSSILKVCDKYTNFDNQFNFRDIDDMRRSAKGHLMLIEWYEEHGLKIDHQYNPSLYNYFKTGEYLVFNYFGDAERDKANGSGKYISWSDDDRQPKDEWLLNISFPTGAYIFGDDYNYQQELFRAFVQRLKEYKPDYSDTANKSFYWKLDNSKAIFEGFNTILQEFHEKNRSEMKSREAEKLRKRLKELES